MEKNNYDRLRKWAKDAAAGKTDKIPYLDITNLIDENVDLRAALAMAEGAPVGVPLTIWSMSGYMGAMVPNSPRQAGRKQFYAADDVDALLAQRSGSEAVPPASGKSPCIEDRDGIPTAMRKVIETGGSYNALRCLYRLINTWGAEQRADGAATAPPPQPDSGRDALLKSGLREILASAKTHRNWYVTDMARELLRQLGEGVDTQQQDSLRNATLEEAAKIVEGFRIGFARDDWELNEVAAAIRAAAMAAQQGGKDGAR